MNLRRHVPCLFHVFYPSRYVSNLSPRSRLKKRIPRYLLGFRKHNDHHHLVHICVPRVGPVAVFHEYRGDADSGARLVCLLARKKVNEADGKKRRTPARTHTSNI